MPDRLDAEDIAAMVAEMIEAARTVADCSAECRRSLVEVRVPGQRFLLTVEERPCVPGTLTWPQTREGPLPQAAT